MVLGDLDEIILWGWRKVVRDYKRNNYSEKMHDLNDKSPK
jgi:hypothetical protein